MLKISIFLSDSMGTITSEVSTSEVGSETPLTNIEWIDVIRRSLMGIGFCSETVSKVINEEVV